jgi:exoribonuclease II
MGIDHRSIDALCRPGQIGEKTISPVKIRGFSAICKVLDPDQPPHLRKELRPVGEAGRRSLPSGARAYFSLLKKYSAKWTSPVMAYCLMTNHVHLLTKPGTEESLFKIAEESSRGKQRKGVRSTQLTKWGMGKR